MDTVLAAYEIDATWKIVNVNDAFCRHLHATESGLVGRDIRDLLREDWLVDFRAYVARALVGIGSCTATIPLTAPCGTQAWFDHALEPLVEHGLLCGYRARIVPHAARVRHRSWWPWDRHSEPAHHVWDFEAA